jgi:hypothetical protein
LYECVTLYIRCFFLFILLIIISINQLLLASGDSGQWTCMFCTTS